MGHNKCIQFIWGVQHEAIKSDEQKVSNRGKWIQTCTCLCFPYVFICQSPVTDGALIDKSTRITLQFGDISKHKYLFSQIQAESSISDHRFYDVHTHSYLCIWKWLLIYSSNSRHLIFGLEIWKFLACHLLHF